MLKRRGCSNSRRRGLGLRSIVRLTLAVVVISIALVVHRAHRNRLHRVAEHVYHLKNGRFCYKQQISSGDDTWYWLCDSGTGNYYTSPTSLTGPPPRTVWQSNQNRSNLESKPADAEEEEIESEQAGKSAGEVQEEVAETSDDEPARADEGGASASSGDESSSGGGGGGGDDEGGGGGGGGGDDD